MSFLTPAEPLWFERTQDMSGYVLPHTISPPLDEQFNFNNSTAQIEHDFYLQNSGISSPEEFFLRDHTDTEAIFGEESNMFDNSNYSELHSKINLWLPKISNVDIDEFTKTNIMGGNGDVLLHTNTGTFAEPQKVVKKMPSATDFQKPTFLSIFDYEEPHIKEEPDIFSCCTDKLTFDELRDEMEVAEEVVVTTEEHDESNSKFHPGPFLFSSASSPELLIEPKEEVVSTEELSPLGRSSVMETSIDFDMGYVDDDLFNLDTKPSRQSSPEPKPKLSPRLRLDIEAAMVSSSQLLYGSLPDTPEVLKPVLKPEADFDLVSFLLANGDSNNNRLPLTPIISSSRPCLKRIERRGKSHLSLADLKEHQRYRQGKPSPQRYEEESEPTPGTSVSRLTGPPSSITSSGRPARKSATKFKRLLEEGLLDSTIDSCSVSSEEDESVTKSKRRKSSSSTSSRKRLNSDSDISSVCEGSSKYRERRDRNNLSSKRSRQKRKSQQVLKSVELKELEVRNKKLRKRADGLSAMLDKVHKAWKEYLEQMKKEGR